MGDKEMSEYYDPMLYLSAPGNANTMGCTVTLGEPIDGDILAEAAELLRERFPYFYIRVEKTENDFVPISNPLPLTVRNTWEPIVFHTEASNYHLMAIKYEGKRLAVEILHGLTDGAGFLPYIKSLLFVYLSKKYHLSLDSTGFRLPGQEIPETESGNPFAHLDVDAAEAPLYQKKPVKDFYRINPGDRGENHVFYVRLPEQEVMRYCRENDGSPNALIAVILARAIRKADPESEKTINITIAVDHKAMLGNRDNYRQFANVAEIDFPKGRENEDIERMCTVTRGKLLLQAQPENSLWHIKSLKAMRQKLNMMPLQMKFDMLGKASGAARWTAAVSYTDNRSFGVLDPYIEEVYVLAQPTVIDAAIEIACVNHSFYLAFLQNFPDDYLFKAFLDELAAAGIPYQLMRDEKLSLCDISWA